MIINLITLATVKTFLGITDTDSDASITAMIPIVSSDIRRILNANYDNYIVGSFDEDSTTLYVNYEIGKYGQAIPFNPIPVGTVVYHENLPADTYISAFTPTTGNYTLSATPDDAGTYVYPHLTISQWPTVSKMIQYKINGLNTTACDDEVKSKSMGGVSITYKDINSKYDYPQKYITDLGVPFARVG
jgi:hypothetical protein